MSQKSVFYAFYGILGAQNYQIRYLGNFNQIWQKIMTASHDMCQMDPIKKCPENVIKLLTRIRLAKKVLFMLFTVFWVHRIIKFDT